MIRCIDRLDLLQRLRGFEAKIHGDPLPPIESEVEPVTL
jgi:hypothetical protein